MTAKKKPTRCDRQQAEFAQSERIASTEREIVRWAIVVANGHPEEPEVNMGWSKADIMLWRSVKKLRAARRGRKS